MENRTFRLTLSSPIWYRSAEMGLDKAIEGIQKKETGFEHIECFSFRLRDESLTIEGLFAGERNGYSAEERSMIESGIPVPRKDEEDTELPAGMYILEQLPLPYGSVNLTMLLLPLIGGRMEGRVFVRLYKESFLEQVMQLLLPL